MNTQEPLDKTSQPLDESIRLWNVVKVLSCSEELTRDIVKIDQVVRELEAAVSRCLDHNGLVKDRAIYDSLLSRLKTLNSTCSGLMYDLSQAGWHAREYIVKWKETI